MSTEPEAVFYNERGLRAGWRLLIFFFMIAAIAGGVQLLLKRVGAGAGGKQPPGYIFPVALGLGEFAPFLILLFLCSIMSKIEFRPVGEYGLPLRKPALSRF